MPLTSRSGSGGQGACSASELDVPDALRVRGFAAQPEFGEKQFGDVECLFQVWIAGRDDGFDADLLILANARGNVVGIADQRRSRAATHQPRSRPQVRTDNQSVAPALMQRRHAFLPN